MINFEEMYSNYDEKEETDDYEEDDFLDDPFHKTIDDIDDDDIPEIPDLED